MEWQGPPSIWLDNNNNGVFDGTPIDVWLADLANASIAGGATSTYNIERFLMV